MRKGVENFAELFNKRPIGPRILSRVIREKGDAELSVVDCEQTSEMTSETIVCSSPRRKGFHGTKKEPGRYVSSRQPYVRAIERFWWSDRDRINGSKTDSVNEEEGTLEDLERINSDLQPLTLASLIKP